MRHVALWRRRLREAIDRSGIKHSVIAMDAQVTPESLSRILTAVHVHPRFDTVVRIVHAAGETVEWLLEERGYTFSAEERGKLREAAVVIRNATRRDP